MSYPTGKVQLFDADGVLITTLDLDENGVAYYTKTLTDDDVGRDTYRAVLVGDNTFVGAQEDTFTLEVVDENGNGGTKSRATGVTKIVAGPGIYISPKSGTGVVTISTRPISDAGTEDFLRVRWTQTESTKYGTDLSFFLAGGAGGLLMSSDNAQDWSDMGPKNTLGVSGAVAIDNLAVLQSSAYPGEGMMYYVINEGTNAQTPPYTKDFVACAWGNLGYTNATGVYTGDNIDKLGPHLKSGGAEITGKTINYSETFLLGSDILGLIFSTAGDVWSFNQLPFDPQVPDLSTLNILTSEGSGLGAVQECWSDIEDSGTGSFTIKSASSNGSIHSSYRSGNGSSSWSQEYSGSDALYGIKYGGGTWIAVGNNDTIIVDGVKINSGLGANWRGVAYGNGRWVICGEQGKLAISDDGGYTWTGSDSSTKGTLWDVAYSPTLRTFAAVGDKRASVAIRGY